MKAIQICILLLFLGSCFHDRVNLGITNGNFKGKAILLFHEPLSGNTTEIFIFPINNYSKKGISKIPDNIFKELEISNGVSVSSIDLNSFLKEIQSRSKKISLNLNEELADNLKYFYYCIVYVDFKNAKNITSETTGSKNDFLELKFKLINGDMKCLKYYIASATIFKKALCLED